MHIIHTVIEFYRLIPVIFAWIRSEAVVSRGFGRIFMICILSLSYIELGNQFLTGYIVKIITGRKMYRCIVVLSEIFHTGRFSIRNIMPGYVVGYKINYNSQSLLMSTLY